MILLSMDMIFVSSVLLNGKERGYMSFKKFHPFSVVACFLLGCLGISKLGWTVYPCGMQKQGILDTVDLRNLTKFMHGI